MRRIKPLLFILTLLTGVGSALAQAPGVSIGFHNDTKQGILVQGFTTVNGKQQIGQPFLVTPGKTGYDSNVPQGIRFVTIRDSSQPARVLLANAPLQVFNRDMVLSVRPGPNGQLMLMPKK